MQTAYMNLIRYALARNMTVSVWDGEEWQIKRSKSFKKIVDAVNSVDEAALRIRDDSGSIIGWALVSADCGLNPDETVIDHTLNEFMEGWSSQYEATL